MLHIVRGAPGQQLRSGLCVDAIRMPTKVGGPHHTAATIVHRHELACISSTCTAHQEHVTGSYMVRCWNISMDMLSDHAWTE